MEKDWMLYQLYDKVAETVSGPLFGHVNDASAIRMFYELLGNRQSMPGQHPGDFTLLLVGAQSREGVIEAVKPQPVATGAAWLEQQNRERLAQTTMKLEA